MALPKLPELFLNRDVSPEMVWIDLETCGLKPEDRILEVGVKVTNRHGDERASFSSVVGYGDAMVSGEWLSEQSLGPVVHKMHTENGLINEVLIHSSYVANYPGCAFSRPEVETRSLNFLWEVFGGQPEPLMHMAGASVQFDRATLKRQMPRLHNWFHYRQYDVSTVLTLASMSGNLVDETVQRRGIHRALPDIDDEISVHRWAMRNLVVRA